MVSEFVIVDVWRYKTLQIPFFVVVVFVLFSALNYNVHVCLFFRALQYHCSAREPEEGGCRGAA